MYSSAQPHKLCLCRPGTVIMGDATAACLVVINGPGDAVGSYATRTLSEFSSGMLPDEEGWPRSATAQPLQP